MAEPVKAPDTGVKKILIVEDESEYRDVLSQRLTAEGYKVLSASSGKEALNLLQYATVDLITLDLIMPEMDGIQFMYNLKNTINKNVPVVILTNLTQVAYPPGVKDFIVKTEITLSELINRIKSHLTETMLDDTSSQPPTAT